MYLASGSDSAANKVLVPFGKLRLWLASLLAATEAFPAAVCLRVGEYFRRGVITLQLAFFCCRKVLIFMARHLIPLLSRDRIKSSLFLKE